jgi:TPR repeat protein
MKSPFSRRAGLFLGLLLTTVAPPPAFSAGADESRPTLQVYLSPDVDFAKICRVPPPDLAERDWTTWKGEPVEISDDEMLKSAKRLAGGTALVKRDRAAARRVFEYLLRRDGPHVHAAKFELGQLLLDPASGPIDVPRGLALIREAAKSFNTPAILALGELHQRGNLVAQDLAEAARLFRQAAALGSADGAMHLLQLLRSGALGPVNASALSELSKVTLAMLHGQLGRGDCAVLRKIARLQYDEARNKDDIAAALRWVEAAIRVRDVDAALTLAEIYRSGVGVEVDARRSIELLTFAAEEGSSRAMRMLGEAYIYGNSVSVDRQQALHWLARAADARDAIAFTLMSRLYRGDFGGEPDPEAYASTLERAITLPDARPELFTGLGRAYLEGAGVRRDIERALVHLERGAALGDPQALVELANFAIQSGQFSNYLVRIRSQLRAAANDGSGQAMRLLSELYSCGIGAAPDKLVARRWLERAGATGDVRSLKELARLESPDRDSTSAARFKYLRRAAVLGDRPSMVEVALAYRHGLGTDEDAAEANYWRSRALAPGKGRSRALLTLAKAGAMPGRFGGSSEDVEALLEGALFEGDLSVTTEIGKLLVNGASGIPQKRGRGIDLLVRAARAGDVEAMTELADLSDTDLAGSGRKSFEWLMAAALAGNTRAITALAVNASTEQDALQWLKRVEQMPVCDGEGMIRIAIAYGEAPGAAARHDRAKYWLDRARQMQDLDGNSLFLLSRALAKGIGTAPSANEAVAVLRHAAEMGHVEAMREIGRIELETADSTTELASSLDWFEKAFTAGDTKAVLDSSRVLDARAGLTDELADRVVALLQQAAELGSPRAMREVGLVLQRGRGLKAAPEKSVDWLLRAATEGDAIAMREVAMAYASGFGIPLSATKSTEWMKKAAEAGDVKAMRELSSAFKVGFGVSPDQVQAERWAKAASTVPQELQR